MKRAPVKIDFVRLFAIGAASICLTAGAVVAYTKSQSDAFLAKVTADQAANMDRGLLLNNAVARTLPPQERQQQIVERFARSELPAAKIDMSASMGRVGGWIAGPTTVSLQIVSADQARRMAPDFNVAQTQVCVGYMGSNGVSAKFAPLACGNVALTLAAASHRLAL